MIAQFANEEPSIILYSYVLSLVNLRHFKRLLLTAEQIEKILVEMGLSLGEEWPEPLRRSFINFVEEFEISCLDEPPNHLIAP